MVYKERARFTCILLLLMLETSAHASIVLLSSTLDDVCMLVYLT